MLESTPGTPFCALPCFPQVEQNMALRRAALLGQLDSDEGPPYPPFRLRNFDSVFLGAFTMSHFPMIGTPDHTFPPTQVYSSPPFLWPILLCSSVPIVARASRKLAVYF